VREVLEGQHYTTANKKLSHLKGYWRWLTERGIAKSNPWNGQRVRAPRQLASDEEEKAFTDAQVVTLLTSLIAGSNGARLRDVMMIAALSGMRIEEICQLSVKDCQEGVFNIRQSKTRAGRRRVPMHSRLVDLIERRMSEKAGDDFLIHEITGRNLSRSDSLIKQFIRHRRRYGVDEKVPGHRRSLVNFHSWRRWFVSRAIQAGIPVLVVESVIGHKSQNLAVGVYSEGASEQQMRECVEAVVLPDGIPAKSL
jgi:integrase